MMSSTKNVEVNSAEFLTGELPMRQVLADGVYLRLKSLIMESTIPPGSRLNIEEISRTLGVSATPVRESLARLESDGLVDKLALKGYRTTELLNREQLVELYELRMLLEPDAAAKAAILGSTSGIDQLKNEMTDGQILITREQSELAWDLSNHDVKFHDLVLELAGNETIRQAYARTHCHLHTFRLAYAGTFGRHTIEEHSAVFKSIEKRDADKAHDSMLKHITASRDRMLKWTK